MAPRDLTSKVVITAADKTGGAFSSVAAKLRALASQARQVRTTTAQVKAVQAARTTATMAERTSSAFALASRFAAPVIGGAALNSAVKQYAELDRRITRIGITADAGSGEVKGLADNLYKLGQSVALPTSDITTGLEVLVAQGRNLKDSMAFLPSVAKTAAATGASVEDIAKSADSVATNFKVAGSSMQDAFDIMAAGGKAGMFELKDMARYIPSLGPAASAIGFEGTKGLSDLVAMLQVIRKGSGTSEEAVSSMNNILAKMESDKTTKNFKALGVDSEKAFKKARKEGRNLVEVFEELAQKALKGDRSRLGELIDDMEFKRGVQALMTYRGEWQKLSDTMQRTSRGTVASDLKRVENDLQAKLDRMSEVVKKRAREIGGFLSENIIIPLDNKITEISEGKNKTFNKIDEKAKYYNADIIAREEMRTGRRGDYDPETRRVVDARKEFVQRELIDKHRAGIDGDIAAKQRVIDWSRARNHPVPHVEKELADLQAKRAGFDALVSRVDNIQVRLTETGKGISDSKNLAIPNARVAPGLGVGSTAIGAFGLNGFRPVAQHWDTGTRVNAPLPPSRPASLPQAPAPTVTEDQLKQLFPGGSIKLDTSDAKELSTKLEGSAEVKVDVNVKLDMGLLRSEIQREVRATGHLSAGGSTAVGSTGKTMPEASGGGGGGGGAH